MFPIVSVVGKSQSGKTILLEQLIGELISRGHRLATIKNTHADFTVDHPGKDSWRFSQAGSNVVVVSGPQTVAVVRQMDHQAALQELFQLIGGEVDLILTEGFKGAQTPKIEVHRKELGNLVSPPEQLLAIVTDEPLDIAVPQYSAKDVKPLANLIEESILASPSNDEALLMVNGTPIPLNPFVKNILGKTLVGMVSTLRGGETINNLHIWLRRERD